MNPEKNSLMKFHYVVFTAMLFSFLFANSVHAGELKTAIEEIVQDFERHIGNIPSNKKYYIVVRSFLDRETRKEKIISDEIEDTMVDIIVETFRAKKNVVILERKRLKAIEKEVAAEANEIHFEEGVLEKKLGKKLGAGFLITGTTSMLTNDLQIRAKMIDIVSGEVLASSSGTVRLNEIDSALLTDYSINTQPENSSESEPESHTLPDWPLQNTPEPVPNIMAEFCCDLFQNKRCMLFQPVHTGSPCLCMGQGWGTACQ